VQRGGSVRRAGIREPLEFEGIHIPSYC